MGFVEKSQLEEIRRRMPLEELIPEYGVQLVPDGRDFKALCPFHSEKTPSFRLDAEKQLYHCFGCQEGGDLFSFVQKIEGVGFSEAVELLARRLGLELRYVGGRGKDDSRRVLDLYEANELAAEHYHRLLLEHPGAEVARAYLRRRGLDPAMWERFRLGWALPEWDDLLRYAASRNTSAEVLERAGLARRRKEARGPAASGRTHYDLFRERLMFPITDGQRRVVGFGGRTLREEDDSGRKLPKYVNTPETEVFDKSRVLYGIAQARPAVRRENRLVIVEGYTDVIAAHQGGVEYVVASLGTAFTRQNAESLAKLASSVWLVFDGDAAGQRAQERSVEMLVGENLDVRLVTMPGGKDPCELVIEQGGEAFRRALEEGATDVVDFKWRAALGAAGDGSTARTRAADACLRFTARIPNPIAREEALQRFAYLGGFDPRVLRGRLEELGAASRQRSKGPSGGSEAAPAPPLGEHARAVLGCLLALPAQASAMWAEVPREVFSGPAGEEVAAAVDALLAAGEFRGEELARGLRQDAARNEVVRLLRETDAQGEVSPEEHRARWRACQRDLRRWLVRGRLRELDSMIAHARAEGDQERVRTLLLEKTGLQKRLKSRPDPALQ